MGCSRFSWEAIAICGREQVFVGNSRLLWDSANSEEAVSALLVKTAQCSSDSGMKARHRIVSSRHRELDHGDKAHVQGRIKLAYTAHLVRLLAQATSSSGESLIQRITQRRLLVGLHNQYLNQLERGV